MIRASFDLDERPVEAQVDPAFEEELDELLQLCRENLPQVNDDLIRRAFVLSYWAHRGVERASSDPYVTHPLEVAKLIATDIGFDDVSVAARVMSNHKIHRVVVTHERKVVGMLSAFDLLKLIEGHRFVAKNAPTSSTRRGAKRT